MGLNKFSRGFITMVESHVCKTQILSGYNLS